MKYVKNTVITVQYNSVINRVLCLLQYHSNTIKRYKVKRYSVLESTPEYEGYYDNIHDALQNVIDNCYI